MQVLVQSTMWQEYIYQDPTSSHPYFVYTPTTYHVGTAVPLLVMLHGCTQTAADFAAGTDRKSTRLNSSHLVISYAVFCLKKKITITIVLLSPHVYLPRAQSPTKPRSLLS